MTISINRHFTLSRVLIKRKKRMFMIYILYRLLMRQLTFGRRAGACHLKHENMMAMKIETINVATFNFF